MEETKRSVASVRLCDDNAAMLSSYARLAGTTVEEVITRIVETFIDVEVKKHINLIRDYNGNLIHTFIKSNPPVTENTQVS
jgi:hypothetical protein